MCVYNQHFLCYFACNVMNILLMQGDIAVRRNVLNDHTLYDTQPELLVQTQNLGTSLRTSTRNRTLSVRPAMLHLQVMRYVF